MPGCHFVISKNVLTQELYYKNQVILTYTIYYPRFLSKDNMLILDQINAYYSTKAMIYINKNIMNLYQEAMVAYILIVMNIGEEPMGQLYVLRILGIYFVAGP
jgi:hypothetical protein